MRHPWRIPAACRARRLVQKLHLPTCALLAITASVLGAEPKILPLWPEGVPDLKSNASDEKIVDGRITNIHRPTLTVFEPRDAPGNATAVIVCPGGGYVRLAIGAKGGADAQWLNGLGVTVFVLKYRLAEYGHPAPLRDVLRAVRLVRSRAAEFGVQTNRIGVLGGSAGGHLAACAATLFDAPEGRTGSPLDRVSGRPDFVALIYPVITMEDPWVHRGSRKALLGENPSPELIQRLSAEQHVRKETPPVFLVATMADRSVPVENSLLFYQALRRAGVPAEMHVYAQGAHGNSRDPQFGPTAQWPEQCEAWLRFNGWLPKSDR